MGTQGEKYARGWSFISTGFLSKLLEEEDYVDDREYVDDNV